MSAVFESCRWLNQYLGVFAALCVMRRLVPLVLDRPRWLDPVPRHRILVFVLLAGFELLTATAANENLSSTPHWYSAGFTLLHVSTICLCVWWPHPTRMPQPDRQR